MKYTLYKVDNSKPSKIRGFWVDNGKLYRDNIIQVNYNRIDKLNEGIQALSNKGEKAVFFVKNKIGVCIDKKGHKTVYHNKIVLKRSKLSIKEIKGILALCGGLTIYKQSKGLYFIEVYIKKAVSNEK